MATTMTTNAHLVPQNMAAPVDVKPLTPPINKPSEGTAKVSMHTRRDLSDDPQRDSDAEAQKTALRAAMNDMEKHFSVVGRDLNISVDQEAGMTVLKVVDSNSGETIRQIPTDEVLKMAKQRANDPDAGYPFLVDTNV